MSAILPVITKPSLTGQKPCLAGTYVAEQTSKTSCELLSVTSPKSLNSPKKLGGAFDGRRMRRKEERNLDNDNALACTVLPALSTIEPLLLGTSEGFFQPGAYRSHRKGECVVKGPEEVPERRLPDIREAREHEIQRVVARLHKGVRHSPQLGPASDDECTEQSDFEVMAKLTRPRTGSRLAQEFERSTKTGSRLAQTNSKSKFFVTATSSSGTGRTGKKAKERKHANHYDLFASALPAADIAPTLTTSRNKWIATGNSKIKEETQMKAALMTTSIQILPEDAVGSFFEEEERLLGEKAEQGDLSMTVKGVSARAAVEKVLKKNKELLAAGSASALRPAELQPEVVEAMRKQGMSSDWEDLLEAVGTTKKIDKVRRLACESLRMFVFGVVGNENETLSKEKEKIYYEGCGEYSKVIKLWKVWQVLDDDHSGRVDISEFRAYAEKIGQKKLGEKAMGALLGKKSSFSLEDMMRLIWPCAQAPDLGKMNKWIKEYVASMRRVPTPPVLSQSEYEGLIENFRFFDADGSGYVSVEELVSSGLLDKEQAQRYLAEWDEEGAGEFSEVAFCHMLCPSGYRAYSDAPIATDKDGNQVVYEEQFGWRLKNHVPTSI